ncbi:hypothetical protein SAMN05421636_10561 [Pricia antarctica]|uniref:Uncharacterized protein n=1 Tax=Pricia antarctica TaxID=641691 RepID=A0A1G7CWR8_9FLAO|nr:hypothetical protein [Pricia antarctica]SDE43683.1 hypothetical protein SAMN05421636_10561 [Pricia antarctica]
MKSLKNIVLFTMSLIGVLFLGALWYMNTYSMDEAKAFEVHSPNLEKKLLVATQGSDFKNSVTAGIVEYYEQDSIYIKVIDVSDLGDIDPKNFDALLIIHTWENRKPPTSVQTFTDKNQNTKNKTVMLTTSGEGSYKMGDVDAITGESIVADAPLIVDKIINKLKPLLEK